MWILLLPFEVTRSSDFGLLCDFEDHQEQRCGSSVCPSKTQATAFLVFFVTWTMPSSRDVVSPGDLRMLIHVNARYCYESIL